MTKLINMGNFSGLINIGNFSGLCYHVLKQFVLSRTSMCSPSQVRSRVVRELRVLPKAGMSGLPTASHRPRGVGAVEGPPYRCELMPVVVRVVRLGW